MSSDRDALDLLRNEPAPPMHVDLTEVVALGRRRTRRRAAGLAVVGAAAAVAVLAVGASLLSAPGNDTTTPAATSSTGPRASARTSGSAAQTAPSLSGRRTLTVGDAAYTMSVGDEVLTIDVVRGGHRERSVAGLLGSGGTWRVIDGTGGRQVLTGIVPGVADAIELLPPTGEKVQEHTVALARGRDFTAFVVTFAQPLDSLTPAVDVGWGAKGTPTSWVLGTEPGTASLAVTMVGEGTAPLAPYDFTRTGPPASGSPGSVVISVDVPDARIGRTAVATLQGDLTVKDPAGLVATLVGRDPESSVARGTFQLTDGRTFAWGVAPSRTRDVRPHLDGTATAGKAVLASMMDTWTAYAVQVDGDAAQVSGIDVTLGGTRGGFGVIE
ncbi:hypothetical protein [Pedococcus soli]